MRTYRFHAYPAGPYFRWSYSGVPALSADSLVTALAGGTVRELVASRHGGYEVDIQLDRPTHTDALADIESALWQMGFETAQALITEWASSLVEGALLGTAGGGAIGSASKDPIGALVGAIIGLAVGAVVGSTLQTAKVRYQADRLHPHGGGWLLTQLQPPQPTSSYQPYAPWA